MAVTDWSTETILVVDDAEAIRKLVCAMLSASGYNCLEASDGHEALRIVEDSRHTFKLVLTDMIMPKMNGVELARHVQRIRPEVPIVFMSGYVDDPIVRHVGQSATFLPKPFTATDLLETVRQSLDRP
jgi:two-component system cell cycle sensor histidine kinase/response regulator CckA